MKTYNIDGKELTRDQLIRFLCVYIDEHNCADQVRNILPNYTVLQNIRHHPVRIALELNLLKRTDF